MSTRYGSVASRDDAVIIIVDIQERLAAAMSRKDQVIDRVALLIESARIVGLPALVTRQYPKGLGDLCPEVAEALESAERHGGVTEGVDKLTFDCFAEPQFVQALERSGRRQLIVAGMETHICVCQTTLAALTLDFDVHVVDDACCSRSDRSHEVALRRMATEGATITSAESVAYELVGRAGTAEFKELLAAVKG